MTTSGHPWFRAPEEGSLRHKGGTLARFYNDGNRINMPKTWKPSQRRTRTKLSQLLRSAAVLRPAWLPRAGSAAALASLLVLVSPAPGGADTSSLRRSAEALRAQNATLADQSHSTLVELYSLESELNAATARVDALRAQVAAVERERASVHRRLVVVRQVFAISRRNLGRRLVSIYEQGEPDPLAILLGSESLDDVLTDLDHLDHVASQDRTIMEQARKSRLSLRRLTRSLAQREANLESLERQAAAAADGLNAARTERVRYLAELSSEQRLNEEEIGSLEARARSAERRSRTIAAREALAPAPVAAAPAPPPEPVATSTQGRALTVVATAYALTGTTATGLPVGPGIVAVDPTVIPLGTHMTIPGYGEGIAADTGGAIKGARIDVWVPSEAQAEQWGVKTVTISLHG